VGGLFHDQCLKTNEPSLALKNRHPYLSAISLHRFSKKLTNHAAAVSLYVSHYNLCRVHEALRTTPAVALGIADRVWTIGDLIDAVLPLEPNKPVRVKRNFVVIGGGRD
jgi:hypothetical protein